MKRLVLPLVVFACVATSAEATLQEPDHLICMGRTFPIHVYPLESHKLSISLDSSEDGVHVWQSNNLRGYVATWEVTQGKLWLSEIRVLASTEPKNLDSLFPGEIVEGRVHAKWFSGRLYSPGYRWGAILTDRTKQEAEARLLIHVFEGIVQKIEACDVPRLSPKPVIACYGDSITAGANLAANEKYPAVLEALVPKFNLAANENYPAVLEAFVPNAKVHNLGIGGNTSSQGRVRLEEALQTYQSALSTMFLGKRDLTQTETDVLTNHPDLVILLFGTNDSVLTAAGQYRVPVEKYRENLRQMILGCRKANAEVILCTLLPIIPEPYYTRHPKEFYDAEVGLETILHRYRTAAMDVGKELQVPVVDLYKTFEKDLTLLRPAPDGVHPNARGAQVIAQEIAKLLSPKRKSVPLENTDSKTKLQEVNRQQSP